MVCIFWGTLTTGQEHRSSVQGRLPVHGGQRWRKVWPVLNTYCPYFYHASCIDVATLPKKWLLLPTPLKGIRSNYGKNSLYSFVKLKEVLRVNCRFKVKSWQIYWHIDSHLLAFRLLTSQPLEHNELYHSALHLPFCAFMLYLKATCQLSAHIIFLCQLCRQKSMFGHSVFGEIIFLVKIES